MYTTKKIIHSQIKPALGCTEPAAIALNASYLKTYLKSQCKKIELTINTNLLKNAMYVPIPNTGRKYGVKLAFALGFICGNKKKGLNIFADINNKCLKKAEKFANNIIVNIIDGNEIFIKSTCMGYEVFTQTYHDNIVYVKTPGDIFEFKKENNSNTSAEIEQWFKSQPFEKIYELIENDNDYSFIKECIDMNLKLSTIGLNENCGLNIGKSFKTDDIKSKMISVTTAASDARMEGVNFPAMSLVGSGNHGISATLPVWVYANEKNKNFASHEAYKAVALSMLITIYVKMYLGRLSPICGAAFASGCGVAGSIAYLESKNIEISKNAVKMFIQTINGIICEGAKIGCSLKVMQAVQNGYDSAMFALEGKPVLNDGILEVDLQKTLCNLSTINNVMKSVDNILVDIMKNKIN